MLLQRVSNHPAHILNNEGDFSMSSFIPFCSFGEELIGDKLLNFSIPLCNIFKPRNYFDQLCYEADLQELKEKKNEKLTKQLEMGLTLILDYNEERQMDLNTDPNSESSEFSLTTKISYSSGKSASIYLDTISIATILDLTCFE